MSGLIFFLTPHFYCVYFWPWYVWNIWHVSELIKYEGGPKKQNLLIKIVYSFSRLNFNHLQSTLHLMEYTYWDVFSTTQNRFWTPWFLCLLVFLPFFCFTFITWKNISHWRLFSSEETNKVTQGETRWIEKVGYGGHAIFSQKLLNTESSEQCGQVH